MRQNFGRIMKNERDKKSVSQVSLAHAVGKSPQLICDIEAGRKKPGRDTLIAIAKELKISLDDIFLN